MGKSKRRAQKVGRSHKRARTALCPQQLLKTWDIFFLLESRRRSMRADSIDRALVAQGYSSDVLSVILGLQQLRKWGLVEAVPITSHRQAIAALKRVRAIVDSLSAREVRSISPGAVHQATRSRVRWATLSASSAFLMSHAPIYRGTNLQTRERRGQ